MLKSALAVVWHSSERRNKARHVTSLWAAAAAEVTVAAAVAWLLRQTEQDDYE